MIASVRLKVELRIKAAFERWETQLRTNRDFQRDVDRAQENFEFAKALAERFRYAIRNETPGAEVDFGREHVSVRLPNRYPQHQVPVVVALPPALRTVAWPAGLTKQEF